jgi:carbonic anhydrase
MINQLVEISEQLANKRKQDPVLLARMERASQGQSPRFLLISPITRSGQDLQLLNMTIGEAFHATRVPGQALPTPDLAPTLFRGPASFNYDFPNKKGVIVTFDIDEPLEVIQETIDNISLHPDLHVLPIIAFQVNYESGTVKLIGHNKGRDYESENKLLSRIRVPDEVDTSLLVLICSDSRVHPPHTEKGVPMAIQTLGGYIPRYSQMEDETEQLNRFFHEWLSTYDDSKRILIVAHGSFDHRGPSCGAGIASLKPNTISNKFLRPTIEELERAAVQFETHHPESPEDRVMSLSKAIRANLLTYPPVKDAQTMYYLEIDEILMDTVTNTLFQSDEL